MASREDFFKTYANLPLNLRDEIVLVIDDGPITWRVAYLEISGGTEKGKEILEKLEALDLI